LLVDEDSLPTARGHFQVAALRLLDSKIRDGEFKLILPYRLPLILGHDVAGVVVKAGPRVRQFKPGDEVYARPDDFRIGTFAEFVPVNEGSVALKPKGLTMEEAASIPLVGLTAWQALTEKANLKKGQRVFIQASSGGVGTFAIQLAKHLGATVATTTSSANVALVKSLGADVVIDYRTQDFEDVLRDYDVVLNSQDGKTLGKSLRVLRAGGKLISISGPPDPEFGKEIAAPGFVKLVMRLLSSGVRRMAHGRGIGYSFLFMKANGSQLREITRLIEAGVIRPVIDRVFPFATPTRPWPTSKPAARRARSSSSSSEAETDSQPPFILESPMKIENAVALVTGANRGIGLAFARELLARGARKVYAGARDPVAITQAGVQPLRLDVNRPGDVAAPQRGRRM
jgi:alcohol dehydrogenase